MVDKLSKGNPANDETTFKMNYISALNRLGYWKYTDKLKKKNNDAKQHRSAI